MTVKTRHYLVTYLTVVFCFFAIPYVIYATHFSYRDNPINFYEMDEDKIFITNGLTRRQRDSVKLGFLQNSDPPKVGMFGNHQVRHFYLKSFGTENRRYFFNYFYANLSLVELRDYIAFVSDIGKLPTHTALFQITTPNNDNGKAIIDYRKSLYEDIIFYYLSNQGGIENSIRGSYMGMRNRLQNTLEYSSILLGLFKPHPENRIIRFKDCPKNGHINFKYNPILDFIPAKVESFLTVLSKKRKCSDVLSLGVLYDGSNNVSHYGKRQTLTKDENPLNSNGAELALGDEKKIVRYIRDITRIVERDGKRKAVFMIPPVYESKRISLVDSVMNKALAMVPNIKILDHRKYRDNPKNFYQYDHPSANYFNLVVEELIEKKYVPTPDKMTAKFQNRR